MEALDALAARVVTLARAFERAVNDRGPWTIVLDGGLSAPAERLLLPTTVLFSARFPASCQVDPGRVPGFLFCRQTPVSAGLFDVPDEVPFDLVWEIGDVAAVAA